MKASKDYKDGPQLTYRGKVYDSPIDILMLLDEEPVFEILSNEPCDLIRAASVLYMGMNNDSLVLTMSWYSEYGLMQLYNDILAEIKKSGLMPAFIAYMGWLTHGKFEIHKPTDEELALANYLNLQKSFYYWLEEHQFKRGGYFGAYEYLKKAPLHIKRSLSYEDYEEYIDSTWSMSTDNLGKIFGGIRRLWNEYEQDEGHFVRNFTVSDSPFIEEGDEEECEVRDSEQA